MRKFIFAAAIVLLFAACGGEDNSLTPTPPTVEEVVEVTTDDIVKLFNLDKQMNVYQATEKAKADLGNKTANGKQLNVTSVSVVKSDEEKGTFTLRVMGNSGGKTFTKDVDYTGFAQKPNDYAMASRAVAKWKEGVDYLKDFDFDTLYRLKDNSKFTAGYMQKFIDLSSSSVGGSNQYTFTPADWANTTISDVRYDGSAHSGHIVFTITYKGRKGNMGNSSPSVTFDKNLYYANLVTANTEEASKYYMRGAYEHADVFYTHLLKFDRDKFIPLRKGTSRDDNSNSLTYNINLVANDGHETELANFQVKVTGFKPLSALNDELIIAGSAATNEFFKKHFANKANGDYTDKVKSLSQQLWFDKVQMTLVRNGENIMLYADKTKSENGNFKVTAWVPKNNPLASDIFFLEPRIEVLSAAKKGSVLTIKYKLVFVNDATITGSKERTLEAHL